MWFKQLAIFRLPEAPSAEVLAEKLAGAQFAPCMGLDWFSEGFAAPAPFSPELVFPADHTQRIALRRQERVLPTAVIRDILDDKVGKIQQAEGRSVGRKEKQELKEQIIDDLLPRAFTKSSRTEAVIDTKHGLLLVNSANAAKAELLLAKLRTALGGLTALLPRTVESPRSLMTRWLLDGAAQGEFALEYDANLRGAGDMGATVRVGRQDLTADEVISHAKNGKTVTELGLRWNDRISFVLTQDFTFKRIQFLDALQEEAEGRGDDMASLMYASQIMMTYNHYEMIDELAEHLGGWQD